MTQEKWDTLSSYEKENMRNSGGIYAYLQLPNQQGPLDFPKEQWRGGRIRRYADGGPAGEIENIASEMEDEDNTGEDTIPTIPLPRRAPFKEISEGEDPEAPTGDLTAGRASPFAPGRGGGLTAGLTGMYGKQGVAGSTNPYMALMQAGLGMLAASGQRDARGLPMSPLGAIGQGGLLGVQSYQQGQQQAQKDLLARQAMGLKLQAMQNLESHRRALESIPRVISADKYGNPIRGTWNRGSGKWEPLESASATAASQKSEPTETTAQAGFQPQIIAEGKEVEPHEAQLFDVLKQDTSGPIPLLPGQNPKALEGVSDEDTNLIKGIAAGRRKPLYLGRNNPYNRYIMQKVSEYDPGFDETAFSRRQRTANEFAVGARFGANIASMNTLAQHMDKYNQLITVLDRGRLVKWNEVRDWAAREGYWNPEKGKGTEQDLLRSIDVARKGIADEAAKVFAGSGVAALEDRRSWYEKFDPAIGRKALTGGLGTLTDMVVGRLRALGSQYNQGMRTNHKPMEFLSPEVNKIYDRLQNAGIPGFEPTPIAPQALSGDDKRALDWANENPDDPRAARIKKKLGVQ